MSENQDHSGERIAKIMARAGLCSRREAESWIEAGRVAVNGTVLDSPAFNVKPDDRVTVDGAPLGKRERTRLFFFHKPRGTVTTAFDPQGRPTVFDAMPEGLPRLVTVGRLDINTEGLLLLTNDGGLARALELPSTGWLRRYRVRAHGRTDQAVLDKLRDGITIDGINYRSIEARLDREQGSNVWLTIGLREGKNREVKKVLEHIGLDVNRLIRISFGPFQLGELEEGAVEEVKTRILKDQLGDKIADLAGADFEAPLQDEAEDRDRDLHRSDRQSFRDDGPSRGRSAGRDGDSRAGRLRRGKDDHPEAEAEAPPLREKPLPGKRKHVSVMREERSEHAQGKGDRRRLEKAETADRKGRAVSVERIVKADRKPGRDEAPAKSRRNAERFSKMRTERDGQPSRGNETLRRPRRPDSEGAERPWKSKFRTDRPGFEERPEGDRGAPRGGERRPSYRNRDDGQRGVSDAPERGEHKPWARTEGSAPRAPRAEGEFRQRRSAPDGEKREFRKRDDRPRTGGDRPERTERKPWARTEGSAPRAPRAEGEFRQRRSAPDGEKREFRKRDDRPRTGGDRPERTERKPWARTEGSAPRAPRAEGEFRQRRSAPDGEKREFKKRDDRPRTGGDRPERTERKPWARTEGSAPRAPRAEGEFRQRSSAPEAKSGSSENANSPENLTAAIGSANPMVSVAGLHAKAVAKPISRIVISAVHAPANRPLANPTVENRGQTKAGLVVERTATMAVAAAREVHARAAGTADRHACGRRNFQGTCAQGTVVGQGTSNIRSSARIHIQHTEQQLSRPAARRARDRPVRRNRRACA